MKKCALILLLIAFLSACTRATIKTEEAQSVLQGERPGREKEEKMREEMAAGNTPVENTQTQEIKPISSALDPFYQDWDLVNAAGKSVNRKVLTGKDYILVYFGAIYCPYCRAFTPSLIEFYKKNQKNKNIEVVLFPWDRSEKDMLNFLSSYKMPFPALAYANRMKAAKGALNSLNTMRVIPFLVLLDAQGNVLASSEKNGEYVRDYPMEYYLEIQKKN